MPADGIWSLWSVRGAAWGSRWHLLHGAALSRGIGRLASWARRGEDEGRNPTPLLAPWWLNLEPRGSATVFFHLKPTLIHRSCTGRWPRRLQGSSSCWL